MPFRLIAFDCDGVLVKETSAWYTLHKNFGTYEAARPNLIACEAGEIDYPEFMRRDIRLWDRPRVKEIEAILGKYTMMTGASDVGTRCAPPVGNMWGN
jgi:phosphoserine phosphatase